LDIVLGVSMAPSSIQMVVLEGENAEGVTVEEDELVVTDVDVSTGAGAPDHVISAILGTREGAADAGLQLSAIGVTWTDQLEAAVLRDALAAYKLENVMLVSAFLAATALGQSVGGAMGYDRTAVLFVEPESATLAVVETSDGSIADFYKERIDDATSDEATAQLTGMLAGLEETELTPGGVFVVGSGVDIALIKPALESATSLSVSAPEEPQTALARGAALASANAPLFASSTAALAYAQDPGTGVVDPHVLPEYLSANAAATGDELGDGDLAYSAVGDEDADSPTVVIGAPVRLDDGHVRRRPALLLGSGLAVAGIAAVVALEIALAVGIRTTVALQQPTPGQHLIVPAEQAPARPNPEASLAQPKIEAPIALAAPKPLNLPAPAPLPVAAPPAPAVVPVPVVVPPVIVPAPIVHPPVIDAPIRPLEPQILQPRTYVPQQSSPYHQTPPWQQGTSPKPKSPGGEGSGPASGPSPGHGGGSINGPGPEPGGGPFGGGPFGGGPFGGGPFGGGASGPESGPFGGGAPNGGGHFGGGEPGGGGPFGGGGGPFGGGPFGGGASGPESGPFGGGAPNGGGHFGGGEPGSGGPFGGGGFGGGPFGGGGGFGGGGHGGGGFGGGGHSGGGFGGGGHGGGGHH
jgi:hypothetical protein